MYIDKASYLKSLLTSAAEVFHFVLLYSTLLEKLSLSMLPDFPEINYKTPKTLFRNLGISTEKEGPDYRSSGIQKERECRTGR